MAEEPASLWRPLAVGFVVVALCAIGLFCSGDAGAKLQRRSIGADESGVLKVTSRLVQGGWLYVEDAPSIEDPAARPWSRLGKRHRGIGYSTQPPPAGAQGQAMDPERRTAEMAISADPYDLFDAEAGILRSPMERGRDWERDCFFSLRLPGEVPTAPVGAGLRVHGGKSRNMPHPSLRLYFRSSLAAQPFYRCDFFATQTQGAKLDSVVIHSDQRGLGETVPYARCFANPMAYDLARSLGLVAPQTRPLRLTLNGDLLPQLFFLTERMDEGLVADHLRCTPAEFDFMLLKNANGESFADFYREPWRALRKVPAPLTAEVVGASVDLPEFRRWALLATFCGGKDNLQGACLRLRTEQGKLRFAVWDHDAAFLDSTGPKITEDFLLGFKEQSSNFRAMLFLRLLREDPAFAKEQLLLSCSIFNELWTQDFFQALLLRYEAIAMENADIMQAPAVMMADYRRFFAGRPEAYLRQLAAHVGRKVVRLDITGAPGEKLWIDGVHRSLPHRAFHTAGTILKIESPAGPGRWIGAPQDISRGELKLDEDLQLRWQPESP